MPNGIERGWKVTPDFFKTCYFDQRGFFRGFLILILLNLDGQALGPGVYPDPQIPMGILGEVE